MPVGSGVVGTGKDCLVDLSVSVGLVLAFVPAEAAKDAKILGDLLLPVVAETVLKCAEVLMQSDGWDGDAIEGSVCAVEEVLDGFAIGAHVSVVGKEENALG